MIAALAAGCADSGQSFATPEEGVQSLVAALRSGDEAKAKALLGDEGERILHSGDDVYDAANREDFLRQYDARRRLVPEGNDSMTLVVGDNDWPLPIPIRRDGGQWRFDADAGADELIARRVGRNELSAIQTCLAVVDAQQEYAHRGAGGAPGAYAAKFISDPGARNGLYWSTKEGEEMSPLGSLAAEAADEGYTPGSAKTGPRPYHGYCYRMLTSQGSHAPGGARSYLVNGRMTGGFGVIAHPAQYDNSGIMTFIVSADGVVYEADLGADTAREAAAIKSFDPDARWNVVRRDAVAGW